VRSNRAPLTAPGRSEDLPMRKATKAISIRLPVADLERAQQIAAKEGIGYQIVLKRAIQAGLKKVS